MYIAGVKTLVRSSEAALLAAVCRRAAGQQLRLDSDHQLLLFILTDYHREGVFCLQPRRRLPAAALSTLTPRRGLAAGQQLRRVDSGAPSTGASPSTAAGQRCTESESSVCSAALRRRQPAAAAAAAAAAALGPPVGHHAYVPATPMPATHACTCRPHKV